MVRRHRHNLSHYHLTTLDQGQLVPLACVEVLPGDSFRHQVTALIRVQPMVAPTMHPVQVRVHNWFVPLRLLWTGWEDFITGVSLTPPPVFTIASVTAKSLGNYLGLPTGTIGPGYNVSQFPFNAYNLIWNEFYRDQNLDAEIALTNQTLQRVRWPKDYFTTARVQPQAGNSVPVPVRNTTGAPLVSPIAVNAQTGGLDINEWRQYMAAQQMREHRAKFGKRYVDYLRYLGVNPSDARMGRPEYLGGGSQTIAFSEVIATAASGSDVLGDLAGHGIAAIRTRPYNRFFEEHGLMLSLMSVVPKAIYSSGVDRKWRRELLNDYWQKEDEMMGDQPLMTSELYSAVGAATTFGYQSRHQDYRFEQSITSGEFDTTLNFWHFARQFAGIPVLNPAFVECTPPDRPFADKVVNELQIMANHSLTAQRLVSATARN